MSKTDLLFLVEITPESRLHNFPVCGHYDSHDIDPDQLPKKEGNKTSNLFGLIAKQP